MRLFYKAVGIRYSTGDISKPIDHRWRVESWQSCNNRKLKESENFIDPTGNDEIKVKFEDVEFKGTVKY